MPPRTRRAPCQICTSTESKYTCSACMIVYCSVACYKKHKTSSCNPVASTSGQASPPTLEVTENSQGGVDALSSEIPLRPLTSLNWPYVVEESAYPDPLKRDDPKPLQTHQYEAIATSPSIRKTLASHPNLPALLISIDKLRGPDREDALQRALGVTAPEINDQLKSKELGEDVLALRELAEAVEAAVRGGKGDALGLDWGE